MKFSGTRSTRAFLRSHYVQLWATTLVLTLSLGILFSVQQLRSIHSLFVQRITNVVELNKNELLNEMALKDERSLRQHLAALQRELSVDSVALDFNPIHITTENNQETNQLTREISRVVGVAPLSFQMTSEFATIDATLIIAYEGGFANWVLKPFLRLALTLAMSMLLPIGIIFYVLYRRTEFNLINPLRALTAQFESNRPKEWKGCSAGKTIDEIVALETAARRYRELEEIEAFSKVAKQIAHDIRGPLTALNVLAKTLQGASEKNVTLLRAATQRITEIADGLMDRAAPQRSVNMPQPIAAIIESIVDEKRIQYGHRNRIKIESRIDEGYAAFVVCDKAKVMRALANLIDNAVESIPDSGTVTLNTTIIATEVRVEIADTGDGIPENVLAVLGNKVVSHGKNKSRQGSGSGLGFISSKRSIEEAGGDIRVESKIRRGTKITVRMPSVRTPTWFSNALFLDPSQTLVIVDDDNSIHEVWSERLSHMDRAVSHVHFKSLKEFLKWGEINIHSLTNHRFLCDYEFRNESHKVLDVIERLQISQRTTLVTSHWQELEIQERARQLGLQIIPKNLAHLIPIDARAATGV